MNATPRVRKADIHEQNDEGDQIEDEAYWLREMERGFNNTAFTDDPDIDDIPVNNWGDDIRVTRWDNCPHGDNQCNTIKTSKHKK